LRSAVQFSSGTRYSMPFHLTEKLFGAHIGEAFADFGGIPL
jgi:hypothetical protein